jgi:hypothetical protein
MNYEETYIFGILRNEPMRITGIWRSFLDFDHRRSYAKTLCNDMVRRGLLRRNAAGFYSIAAQAGKDGKHAKA